MCAECAPADGWTRRRILQAGAALGAVSVLPRPVAAAEDLRVLPREAWAGDARPAGPVAEEPDVRCLVVHHTVNVNDYGADEVPSLLRDIHSFHTGPQRGWPDIAYNFVVDRFGQAWETRAGSLDRPVAGDATGGSQGFDQKCAFLGDHRTEDPTAEAVTTMTGLLAFLADRSGVDTRPGAMVTFESRGSNLHPPGRIVETATITGHRTMSQTACPGDAAFRLVDARLPAEVTARRGTAPRPPSSTTSTSTGPTTAPTTGSPAPTETIETPSPRPADRAADEPSPGDAPSVPWPVAGTAGGLVAVVLGGLLALKGRTAGR